MTWRCMLKIALNEPQTGHGLEFFLTSICLSHILFCTTLLYDDGLRRLNMTVSSIRLFFIKINEILHYFFLMVMTMMMMMIENLNYIVFDNQHHQQALNSWNICMYECIVIIRSLNLFNARLIFDQIIHVELKSHKVSE